MASKKQTTPRRPTRKVTLWRPLVLGTEVDPPAIEAAPVWAAFEALTGIDPRDAEAMKRPNAIRALNAITTALAAVLKPEHQGLRRWLKGLPTFTVGSDAPRVEFLRVLRWWMRSRVVLVAQYAATFEPKFSELTPAHETGMLAELTGERKLMRVAAQMSLKCGAFGDAQVKGESWSAAVERLTKVYRQADRRSKTHAA